MRFASLCSGIGGLDLAVESVFGCELAWHAEFADEPASIHERHWPGVPNLKDLTAIDWHTLERADLLCAGYPCQPFSHAGARRGEEDERHLWPYINQAVRVLRPRWVVLENVAGHLSLGFGTVLGDLAEAGYDAEWCCVRASDVGAPHGRLRLFVLARDTDQPDSQGAFPDGRRAGRHTSEARGTDSGPADPTGGGRAGRPPEQGWQPVERAPFASGEDLLADPDYLGQQRDGNRGWRTGPEDCDWGPYEPAIRRWEHLTRPAPRPTDDRRRLSPDFVEWMMGYLEGWTAGLKRPARLKALGNAVVPQQGTFALSILLDAWDATAENVGALA